MIYLYITLQRKVLTEMITSKDNQKLKQIRKLLSPSGIKKSELFIIEGERAVMDAVSSGVCLSYILIREDYKGQIPTEDYEIVSSSLFSEFCETDSPQGIIAVAKKFSYTITDIAPGPLLYTDGVRDPGNLGTLIRSADAFGFSGVLLSPDTVSVYNPKVVRSTMGSIFHLPILKNISNDQIIRMKENYLLAGGVLNPNSTSLTDTIFPKNTIVVIGNEANGINKDLVSSLSLPVYIPMSGKAESLNAAVAGGILMYTVSIHATTSED